MSRSDTGAADSYDVLIVGAGPAGASAARELVRRGYRVLILDRKGLPRYKICSGLVNDRAQARIREHFGAPPGDVFCRPAVVDGVRLCLAGDSLTDLPAQERGLWSVWRSAFDYWLVRTSDADVLDQHHLVSFRQTPEGVQARIRRSDGEELRVMAAYLIGADGGRSLVRALLEPGLTKTINWLTATQVYCLGSIDLEPQYFYAFFDASLNSPYAWLNFKDEYVIYGVSGYKGESVGSCLSNTTEYLRRAFGLVVDKVVRRKGCVIADLAMKRSFPLGRGRVLLVGEAAGFMNIFGEGISSALATGHLAATAIDQAERSGRPALPIYAELARSEETYTTQSWELVRALLGRDFLSAERPLQKGSPLEEV